MRQSSRKPLLPFVTPGGDCPVVIMDTARRLHTSDDGEVVYCAVRDDDSAERQRSSDSAVTQSGKPMGYLEVKGQTPQVHLPAELVRRLRAALPGWTIEEGWPSGAAAVVVTLRVEAEHGVRRTSSWTRFKIGIHAMISVVAIYGSPAATKNVVGFFGILSQWATAEA